MAGDPFAQAVVLGGEISAAPHNDAWDNVEDWLNDRLAGGTSAQLIVCDASGNPRPVSSSGDVTVSNGGAFTIGNGKVTAAMLHAAIAPAIGIPPAVELTKSSGQNIANSSATVLTWDTEVCDTNTMHEGVTNPSRITITTAGFYIVTATVEWDSTFAADKQIYAQIVKSGGGDIAQESRQSGGSGGEPAFNLSVASKFAAADYLEVNVFHDAGSTKVVEGGVNSSRFSAVYLGPAS